MSLLINSPFFFPGKKINCEFKLGKNVFHTSVTHISGILRPVALRVWPDSTPTEDKQSRSEARL